MKGKNARIFSLGIGYDINAKLLDRIRLHGEQKEVKAEVIALSKQFGIMTPYTSWLVVEDLERRRAEGRAPGAPADSAMRNLGGEAEEHDAMKAAEDGFDQAGGAGGVAASQSLGKMKEDAGKGFFFGDKDEKKRQMAGVDRIMKTVGDKTFYLASAGDDTVRLWDARTGREVRRLVGHDGETTCLAFLPGGDIIASGGADKTVRLPATRPWRKTSTPPRR